MLQEALPQCCHSPPQRGIVTSKVLHLPSSKAVTSWVTAKPKNVPQGTRWVWFATSITALAVKYLLDNMATYKLQQLNLKKATCKILVYCIRNCPFTPASGMNQQWQLQKQSLHPCSILLIAIKAVTALSKVKWVKWDVWVHESWNRKQAQTIIITISVWYENQLLAVLTWPSLSAGYIFIFHTTGSPALPSHCSGLFPDLLHTLVANSFWEAERESLCKRR